MEVGTWLAGSVTIGAMLLAAVYALGKLWQKVASIERKLDEFCHRNDKEHEVLRIKHDSDCKIFQHGLDDAKKIASSASDRIARLEGYRNGKKNAGG